MKKKKNPSNLLSLWQKLIKTGVAFFFVIYFHLFNYLFFALANV